MKIGFIDRHLNNYHANKFLSIFRDGKAGDGKVEVVAAFETTPQGEEDWCTKNNVYKAISADEVVEKSDAIIVLAPDFTGEHLKLAEPALKSGKPTVLDKALSNNIEDAKKIVEMAKAHNTPIFSSSSLRFSVELETLLSLVGEGPYEGIVSRGFGRWREYAVHTIQPALRLLGGRVKRVIDTGSEGNHLITIENDQGKRAFIEIRECENQYQATPWQVGILHHKNYEIATIKKFDEFYENLLKNAVKFIQTGESPVPVGEMLDEVVVEIAADRSFKEGGKWIEVSEYFG